MKVKFLVLIVALVLLANCSEKPRTEQTSEALQKENHSEGQSEIIKPIFVTEKTKYDTDDPAIWYNAKNPAQSLIIGTDKNKEGALYVYDLEGKIIEDKVVRNLQRPNNVDLEYGLVLNGKSTDIAVVAERITHKLRVFRLPDMKPIDNGGIEIFEGETGEEYRDLMGIALYKNPENGKIYAIAGRKTGPKEGYLWQYLLEDDGSGNVKATLVRKFGKFSGKKEIEAIAVDDELGFIYYSDETLGIRKYYADPEKGNEELALFGTKGFAKDHEGISIYTQENGKGYILVSDQQANQFQVFSREGTEENPHEHKLIKVIKTSTIESDGSETISLPLGDKFPKGMFVAMSDDKTFQIYRWEDLGIQE